MKIAINKDKVGSRKLPQMTNEEFTLYWEPARNTFGPFKGKSGSKDHPSYLMSEALGIHYPALGYWAHIALTDDLKNILLLLAGPYRDTMLKIYQIKHEVNHD